MDEELKNSLIQFLNSTKDQSPKILETLGTQNSEYHAALASGYLIMTIIFLLGIIAAAYTGYRTSRSEDSDKEAFGLVTMTIGTLLCLIGIIITSSICIEHYAASKAPFGRILEITAK